DRRARVFGPAAGAGDQPGGLRLLARRMSRVEGLAEIVLWVADMESSLEFYRDRFGLEVMSPDAMPNKFLMVAKPGGIPEMIVLVPHPHPDSYFPTHREKDKRSLHHLAFRVSPKEYDALEA